jgi:DNA invertase Pin-like site-specific DNA recombinase
MVAIGYIRVSTEDQAKEGVSLDSQRSKIQAYCHLKDLTLREIIEDAGISAKNLRRPGAQKVLKLARRKEIDAVVVYKLDRFFRSTTDALETTKEFEKWGVSFHSIEETLDTRSAMGRFFFTLTAALAEMERRLIGERTKAALSHKRSRNEKTGGDEEQKVIRLIRNLHAQELSLRRICADLERQGYRTKTGNPHWHPETISHIIKRK